MKELKDALQQRLAKRNLAKQSIGAFVVQLAKHYLIYPKEITGYVRWQTLFLRVDQREDKAWLYLKKQQIIAEINKKLADTGYTYVLKEVRIL